MIHFIALVLNTNVLWDMCCLLLCRSLARSLRLLTAFRKVTHHLLQAFLLSWMYIVQKLTARNFWRKLVFTQIYKMDHFVFRFCEKFRNSNLKLYERLYVFYICTSVCTFFTFVRAFVRFCKYWFPFLFFDSKPKIFSPTRLHNYSEWSASFTQEKFKIGYISIGVTGQCNFK